MVENEKDNVIKFRAKESDSLPPSDIKKNVKRICSILKQNGFDPVRQISGYIISDDPAYIPDCDNARAEIAAIDRDALLYEIISEYIAERATVLDIRGNKKGKND